MLVEENDSHRLIVIINEKKKKKKTTTENYTLRFCIKLNAKGTPHQICERRRKIGSDWGEQES